MTRSLGRTACCPALGCMADAGLDGSPQGKGLHLLLVGVCQWEEAGMGHRKHSRLQDRPWGLKQS